MQLIMIVPLGGLVPVCSIINATDHDSDGKCSSSVVVFNLLPLGGLVPVCVPSVQLIMIVMVSVQAVLYLI